MRAQRLLAVLVLGLSVAASGAPKSARQLVRDAEKLYFKARYKEAAELLKKAQELEPNPRILYNIARALDQAGDLPQALDYYRQYVSSSETDPTLLKRSTLAIERLRTLISRQEAEKAVQEAERAKLEEESRAAQAKAEEETRRMEAERLASEERRRVEIQRDIDGWRASRTWAFVSGGAAVLAAGGGALFGIQALGSHDAFTQAGTQAEKDAFKAETQQRALYADALFGAGLALAVTSFFLFPKTPEPAPPEQASPAPAPAPSAALHFGPGSASFEVRF